MTGLVPGGGGPLPMIGPGSALAGRARAGGIGPPCTVGAGGDRSARAGNARAAADLARGAELDQFSQDRDRDLPVRGAPEVEPGRGVDPVELVLGHAPVLEVAKDGRAAALRSDQAEVGRPRGDRLLHGLLVA